MSKLLSLLCLICLCYAVSAYPDMAKVKGKAGGCLFGPYDNDTYQRQDAKMKAHQLTVEILKNTNAAEWPSAFQQAELFIQGMDKSFDFAGDDFPKQGPFNFETRKKLIHSVGSVVNVAYLPVNKTYTGVFQGCTNGLLRFSTATAPVAEGGVGAMTPGIAFKCLRNSQRSGNIFGMYSLIGQSSFNFFAHDLSSHVPELPADGPTSLQLLRAKFASASDFPPFLGTAGLAEYEENGRAPPHVEFPFRLVFHPTTELHKSIPDTYTGVPFYDQIKKVIKPGQKIYDVYGQATPQNETLTLLGSLVATSVPTNSYFGDKSLFFQHTRFETDLLFYPKWDQPARDILAKQRQVPMPGFTFPDLPFN